MKIEIIYSLAHETTTIELQVEDKTSIEFAIEKSGILTKYPEIDLSKNKVGVYSQIKSLDDFVVEGDRVEIYRPLIADPKEARRQRAQKNKPI